MFPPSAATTKKSSREDTVKRAAKEREDRNIARKKLGAVICLQSRLRGWRSRKHSKTAAMKLFDSRLQGIAQLKTLLPKGQCIPLGTLCLLAQSFLFAVKQPSPYSISDKTVDVKFKAMLALFKASLDIVTTKQSEISFKPSGVEKTVLLGVVSHALSLFCSTHVDGSLIKMFPQEDDIFAEAQESSMVSFGGGSVQSKSAGDKKWGGDLPLAFLTPLFRLAILLEGSTLTLPSQSIESIRGSLFLSLTSLLEQTNFSTICFVTAASILKPLYCVPYPNNNDSEEQLQEYFNLFTELEVERLCSVIALSFFPLVSFVSSWAEDGVGSSKGVVQWADKFLTLHPALVVIVKEKWFIFEHEKAWCWLYYFRRIQWDALANYPNNPHFSQRYDSEEKANEHLNQADQLVLPALSELQVGIMCKMFDRHGYKLKLRRIENCREWDVACSIRSMTHPTGSITPTALQVIKLSESYLHRAQYMYSRGLHKRPWKDCSQALDLIKATSSICSSHTSGIEAFTNQLQTLKLSRKRLMMIGSEVHQLRANILCGAFDIDLVVSPATTGGNKRAALLKRLCKRYGQHGERSNIAVLICKERYEAFKLVSAKVVGFSYWSKLKADYEDAKLEASQALSLASKHKLGATDRRSVPRQEIENQETTMDDTGSTEDENYVNMCDEEIELKRDKRSKKRQAKKKREKEQLQADREAEKILSAEKKAAKRAERSMIHREKGQIAHARVQQEYHQQAGEAQERHKASLKIAEQEKIEIEHAAKEAERAKLESIRQTEAEEQATKSRRMKKMEEIKRLEQIKEAASKEALKAEEERLKVEEDARLNAERLEQLELEKREQKQKAALKGTGKQGKESQGSNNGFLKAKSGDDWWRKLEEDDPISMDPINELRYPPFNLNDKENPVKSWFDGRVLAHWIISTNSFTHPTTRQPISRHTCVRLDNYLKQHHLAKPNVLRMYDLAQTSQASVSAEQEEMRSEATKILELLFAGHDVMDESGDGSGGGLIDDDDDDDYSFKRENKEKKESRYLLYSTVDFPSLSSQSTHLQVPQADSSPAHDKLSISSKVRHFVDAANIHTQHGFRGLEIALSSLGVFTEHVSKVEDTVASTVMVYFLHSLWIKLSSAFPRRYNLTNPCFMVGDESGEGLSHILNHMKHHGSRIISNDRSDQMVEVILKGSAPALAPINTAFLQRRLSPYLLTGDAFVLL